MSRAPATTHQPNRPGALAPASAILGDPLLQAGAERNPDFLRGRLWDAESKTLHHRWRDGERDSVQLLDDYAFLLEGVLHLYEATLKPEPQIGNGTRRPHADTVL